MTEVRLCLYLMIRQTAVVRVSQEVAIILSALQRRTLPIRIYEVWNYSLIS